MTNKNNFPNTWIKENLDKYSPTVCGAKWLNATIWLGNGMTSSCHHPPPHKIDVDEIKNNPSAIHNTYYKKLVRKEMLEGKQCLECEYCWKIENLKSDSVSDRYHKSVIFDKTDLKQAFTSDWKKDSPLKTLEISFDSNCNFACSYCNAGYSTTWAHDINKNGPYKDLKSDGWGAYSHNGKWAMPYGPKNENNPYIDAFWKWWESDLQYSLTELRITGGEATISKDFWKLLEWYENNPGCSVRLAVNSNLGVKSDKLQKIINASFKLPQFDFYTSNESVGSNSEFIRQGLNWNEWSSNFERLAVEGNFGLLHVMLTLSSLCLATVHELLEFVFNLREKTGKKIITSYNILRFPSFQSITTLPKNIKEERHRFLSQWFEKNIDRFHEQEKYGFERLLTYILEVEQGHSVRKLSNLDERQTDFYKFFKQYGDRNGKKFEDEFANWPDIVDWYRSLATDIDYSNFNLITGDAVDWGKEIYNEVLKNNEYLKVKKL